MKLSKRRKLNFVISLSQLNREKNYVPPAGLLRLREELKCLRKIERMKVLEAISWSSTTGDRCDNGDYILGYRGFKEIDRFIWFLLNDWKSQNH